MLGRASIIALLLAGAVQSHAQELLYKVGPAPKEWRLPLSEIPRRPQPKSAQAPPPPPGPVGKFDRDFSGPVGSPGFGAPLGFAPPGGVPSGPPPPGVPLRHDWPPVPRGINSTLLLDCSPDHLYRSREDSEGRHAFLFRAGCVCTAHHWKFEAPLSGWSQEKEQPTGEVRPAAMPPVKEAMLSILLGRAVPSGMSFQSEEPKDGSRTEVWREGGHPRILLKKRMSDGVLIEARMMAPGSTEVIEIWQVKEWKDRHPVKAVRFAMPAQNQSLYLQTTGREARQPPLLNGDLYTLVAVSPSRNPTAEAVFGPGFVILDYRAKLESRREGFSYPWKGRLMEIAEMKRIDRERDVPFPAFLKDANSMQTGIFLLGGLCALVFLAVWLSRRVAQRRT